jgi:transcriptional regulator GlxA family with amidase domain
MDHGERLLTWIRQAARHARRVCSVCTGAFILAEAGLLDGRRAVTHWRYCKHLARDYPAIAVEPNAIYTRDGKVWTSAGVSAGVDLSLALVEGDLGRAFATDLARNMVVYFKRSGGQSQYSGLLAAQRRSRSGRFDDLNQWIAGHLERPLGVEELADRAGMSARNFARRFRDETGFTPARFVALARLDAARTALEQTDQSLDQVARSCGFGSEERMRRSFQRHLGVTPSHHRDHHRDRHASP